MTSYRLLNFVFTEDQAYVVVFQDNGRVAFGAADGMVQAMGVGYTIAHAYPDIGALQWAQSADVMFLVDGQSAIQNLERLGNADWQFASDFAPAYGPFGDLNPTINATAPTTLTFGADAGSTTLVASSAAGINKGAGFLSTDVGLQIRVLIPDPLDPSWISSDPDPVWCYAQITAVADTTHATATVFLRPSFPTLLGPSSQWELGAFGATAGWPATVAFWGGRIWYGATAANPNGLWGSAVGNFVDFWESERDMTVTAADAVGFTLDSDQADGVRWIAAAGSAQNAQLGVGTRAGEEVLQSGSSGTALAANSVQAFRESNYGSRQNVRPIKIGKALIWPRHYGRKLNEWQFFWQVNGYVADDLLKLAEHLVQPGGIVRTAWQQEPGWILWCVTGDFRLISLTYLKDQNIAAWAEHPLGGNYYGGAPLVLDCQVIPNTNGGEDELWLAVRRTINGVATDTLEVLQRPFRSTRDGVDGAYFVDGGLVSALTYGAADLAPAIGPASGFANVAAPGQPARWTGTGRFLADAAIFSGTDPGATVGPGAKPNNSGPATVGTVPAPAGAMLRLNGGRAVVTQLIDAQTVEAEILVPLKSLAPAAAGAWSLTPCWTRFSGLDLYDGETVSVYGDGADLGDQMVTGGTIALPFPGASLVAAGFGFASVIEPVKLETEAGPIQTAMGKVKRIHRLYARLYETVGGDYGPDSEQVDPFDTRDAGDPLTLPPPLFTGDRRVVMPGGSGTGGTIHLRQDRPLPMTVLALVAACEVTT